MVVVSRKMDSTTRCGIADGERMGEVSAPAAGADNGWRDGASGRSRIAPNGCGSAGPGIARGAS